MSPPTSRAIFSPQPKDDLCRLAAVGACMLLKVALVLLLAWIVGALNVERFGSIVHLLLLLGLMLLLLGVLKARDAATAADREPRKPPRQH